MISSTHNPKIQRLRALQSRPKERREAAAFVVEGVRLAEEAVNSGWLVREGYHTDELDPRGQDLVAKLKKANVPVEVISESVMKAVSDTKNPQGIVLEVEHKEVPLPSQPTLVLILDGIADPGNLGTLLRSAAAAGADCALLGPGCADPFSPKVLRSGVGAHFRLPIRQMDWPAITEFCDSSGVSVFLAEANEGVDYDRTDLTKPMAVIIGGEAHGTSRQAKALNPTLIRIPMPGQMESLNAATAGSLLLFEALRQRRTKEGTS